jgi:hypothetical protein
MLPRTKSSKIGKSMPQDWPESLSRLLNETYKSECEKNGRYFEVYGQIYAEELLLVISYLAEKDPYAAPVALFLSCGPEHLSNEEKVKETQKNYIDIAGLFFDEIFSNSDEHEFEPEWQEVHHKNQTYFYKISRENINLTLEANKLLGDDFEDIEYEQDQ